MEPKELFQEFSVEQRICLDAISKGYTNKKAAEMAGVTEHTFYDWREKPDFADAIKIAEDIGVENTVRGIAFASQKLHDDPTCVNYLKAALAYLKAKRRNEWGDHIVQEIHNPEPIELVLSEENEQEDTSTPGTDETTQK